MASYILKRLSLMLVTLVGISLINFTIIHMAPGLPSVISPDPSSGAMSEKGVSGDAIDAYMKQFRLDKPIHEQYLLWVRDVCYLEFGVSTQTRGPVWDRIKERMPITLALSIIAIFITYVIAIPVGVWASVNHQRAAEKAVTVGLFFLYSMPSFWVAYLLLLYFANRYVTLADKELLWQADWVFALAVAIAVGEVVALLQWIREGAGLRMRLPTGPVTLVLAVLGAGVAMYRWASPHFSTGTPRRSVTPSDVLGFCTLVVVFACALFALRKIDGVHVPDAWIDNTPDTPLAAFEKIDDARTAGASSRSDDGQVRVVAMGVAAFEMRDSLRFFPAGNLHSQDAESLTAFDWLRDSGWHIILPIICMVYASFAGLSRYKKTAMLQVLRDDYVRTARAKGLHPLMVVCKHALRNGLIPIITLFATLLPALFAGSVIIETIFNIPGMGLLGFECIKNRDYPTLMALMTFTAVLVMLGILASDLTYAVVDPRISLEKKK